MVRSINEPYFGLKTPIGARKNCWTTAAILFSTFKGRVSPGFGCKRFEVYIAGAGQGSSGGIRLVRFHRLDAWKMCLLTNITLLARRHGERIQTRLRCRYDGSARLLKASGHAGYPNDPIDLVASCHLRESPDSHSRIHHPSRRSGPATA